MGLLERVLQEEKKQKAAGLLKRASLIRSLSDTQESLGASSSAPEAGEDEKKNPTPVNLSRNPSPIRKKG